MVGMSMSMRFSQVSVRIMARDWIAPLASHHAGFVGAFFIDLMSLSQSAVAHAQHRRGDGAVGRLAAIRASCRLRIGAQTAPLAKRATFSA